MRCSVSVFVAMLVSSRKNPTVYVLRLRFAPHRPYRIPNVLFVWFPATLVVIATIICVCVCVDLSIDWNRMHTRTIAIPAIIKGEY